MDSIELNIKSNISLNSALQLTSKPETCMSSVHCSYYSCYQMMMHYLETKCNLDDKRRRIQYNKYTSLCKGKPLGSHEYWINEFVKKAGLLNKSNASEIYQEMMSLKRNRTHSDYTKDNFDKKMTDEIYDKARNCILLMNKTFEI